MRNQKGLRSFEASLILVIIAIIGSVACSRLEAGKSLGYVGEAPQPVAKYTSLQKGHPEKTKTMAEQIQQQRDRPEKTDETASWETYRCSKCNFSLRYPRHWIVGPIHSLDSPRDPECNGDSSFSAGADYDFVAECATEYLGQVYVSSEEGNQLSRWELKNSYYPYQNISIRKVTVDNIKGVRETGTAMGQGDERFAMPGLPDGTKAVLYLFYAHGRTYLAQYNQRIGEPDILRDFDLMVTKTLKFTN